MTPRYCERELKGVPQKSTLSDDFWVVILLEVCERLIFFPVTRGLPVSHHRVNTEVFPGTGPSSGELKVTNSV